MPSFANNRSGLSIRRPMRAATPRSTAPQARATMRAPQGLPARPVQSSPQGKYYGHPDFGVSARSSTAQGVHVVTEAHAPRLGTQTLFPAPATLAFKPYTARVSYTSPFGSAPTDTHPGTQTGVTTLRPYGGPPPQPLRLGSFLSDGQATIKRQVLAPPQPNLIPHAFRKLLSRRG